ncbi:phosphotransferase family enzyme [Oryzihumus leptocrescens]|uniref:Phosphotransferase family enzyme n=1 Tax=Oryzihumus leptocrescens TaxID=297536 RepID=A0A542Z8R5_9MICO|nr:aminoglycoside phosphotransferase family protein [Oryzihumus leptocrescens]TQL56692.1 phosphotransferase family enzyme [Oryzihumus leptocrescens]
MTSAAPPDVSSWVAGRCAEAGLGTPGAGELVHDRPWSSAAVFPTGDGRVWFKANGEGTRQEPAVVRTLERIAPGLAPQVVAVDADRGWWLTRDAGPTLRSVLPAGEQWPVWEALLPRYAAAQLELAAHRAELLALGVPERSPATLPEQAADLVEELAATDPARGGLTPRRRAALEARLPAYGQWCAELAADGLPWTLQHDDLHAANVCWQGSAATARVIDWGDASIGHPFGTLLATLNSLARHGQATLEDARVLRVRDALLEPWSGLADRSTLLRSVELARATGPVTRALAWRAALRDAPVEAQVEFDFPVRGWVEEILAG